MTRAATLLLAGSALLLASTAARAKANVEGAPLALALDWPSEQGGALPFTFEQPSFSLDTLTDRVETIMNRATEQPADVPQDTAAANVQATLQTIQWCEGTADQPDPYRVCYGYSHTIRDLSEHPAITGEWRGQRLPDGMCANAGFGPGCVSTAAGAYQLIRPTWIRARDALGLPDFTQLSQDRAAAWLIAQRGALEDVKAGRVAEWVHKCRNEWASLPGNYARQGQRSLSEIFARYTMAGGAYA